jgi:hypothetical protein
MVMRRCRKLVACCSTAISIILLFAGSSTVEPDAMRTTRAVTHQLSMVLDPSTGKHFKSFIQQALLQNFRFGQSRDPANVKNVLETGSIAAAVVPPLASDSRSAVGTNSSCRKMWWGDFHVSLHAGWRAQSSHLVSFPIKTEDGAT